MLILCSMLISFKLCRLDVLSSIILTFKQIKRGLLARLLALLILADHHFLFFSRGPFSLIDVSSCFAAYVVCSLSFFKEEGHRT